MHNIRRGTVGQNEQNIDEHKYKQHNVNECNGNVNLIISVQEIFTIYIYIK